MKKDANILGYSSLTQAIYYVGGKAKKLVPEVNFFSVFIMKICKGVELPESVEAKTTVTFDTGHQYEIKIKRLK